MVVASRELAPKHPAGWGVDACDPIANPAVAAGRTVLHYRNPIDSILHVRSSQWLHPQERRGARELHQVGAKTLHAQVPW
jgi:hypothetical protein